MDIGKAQSNSLRGRILALRPSVLVIACLTTLTRMMNALAYGLPNS